MYLTKPYLHICKLIMRTELLLYLFSYKVKETYNMLNKIIEYKQINICSELIQELVLIQSETFI